MSDAHDPDQKLDWLAHTPLGELEGAIARRLAAAFEAGRMEGHDAGSRVAADKVRAAFQEGEAAASARLTAELERKRENWEAEAASRAASELERARTAWEAAVTARLSSDFEKKLLEREASRAEATLKEAEERGLAFERLMRERERAIEARMHAKLDEERRRFPLDGWQPGPRRSLGIEGSRSWALGVMHLSDEATSDEIRQRFRKLSLLMHPDRQPGLDDAYIKNLQRARDILGG
ncbi:MAG TPA: DnaJ domain-containing protein [Pantanalinema sp.]